MAKKEKEELIPPEDNRIEWEKPNGGTVTTNGCQHNIDVAMANGWKPVKKGK